MTPDSGNLFRGGPIPVLLTVRELNHGGIERDVAKISVHMDRSRFVPHVATYAARGLRYEELAKAGVPVLELPLSSFLSRQALACAFRLASYVRRNRIRVVHSYDPTAAFCAPVARAARVPVVLSSQLGSRELLDARSRKTLRWSDRMVDGFVVNCEAMRRHLVEDEGVRAEAIHLCYNGVDTRQFFPAAQARPEPVADASLVIGAICVLRPEKALDVLQEAFAQVRHLDPRMRLLIVGSGPELGKLQANAARLGIEDACRFHPSTAEVPKFLRAIDIFVLCSHSEAFSNALLEAMACGCAAVGTRVGGTPELTGGNGERGLLCRAGDPRDLAEKLARLIGDEALRRDLSHKAAEFAHGTLSIEKAVERTAAIWEEELRKRRG
ncbi:MAG: glycosyltransferase [Acidobacteriota bacterium]|nr:glycosyltransferase [Acidobacteriota bacterium]